MPSKRAVSVETEAPEHREALLAELYGRVRNVGPEPSFKREERGDSLKASVGPHVSGHLPEGVRERNQLLPALDAEQRERLRRVRVDRFGHGVGAAVVRARVAALIDETSDHALILDERADGWHLHGLVVVDDEEHFHRGMALLERQRGVGVGEVFGNTISALKNSMAGLWNSARLRAYGDCRIYTSERFGAFVEVLGGAMSARAKARVCPICGAAARRITCSRECSRVYQRGKAWAESAAWRQAVHLCACGCGVPLEVEARGRRPKYVRRHARRHHRKNKGPEGSCAPFEPFGRLATT